MTKSITSGIMSDQTLTDGVYVGEDGASGTNGTDGEAGANGQPGSDGDDAYTPGAAGDDGLGGTAGGAGEVVDIVLTTDDVMATDNGTPPITVSGGAGGVGGWGGAGGAGGTSSYTATLSTSDVISFGAAGAGGAGGNGGSASIDFHGNTISNSSDDAVSLSLILASGAGGAGGVGGAGASRGGATGPAGLYGADALTNYVENLTLTGSGNLNGTGNAWANNLTGNSGNNRLDGSYGADTMIGGLGNDTYVVDNILDSVTEGSSAGNALDNFLTGDASDNQLFGDDGDDYIWGGGGTDDLYGGDGDDTYIVDNATTTIHENAHEGIDGVIALVTYTLTANVEDLQMDTSSSDNNDATGNTPSNIMVGNQGDNSIWGLSGDDVLSGQVGHDTLYGGVGDDLYIVYDADAVIVENDGEGTDDTVDTYVTYTLSDHVENMQLDGSDNIDGTGNSGDNYIADNFGDNVLTGGDGDDTLDSLYGTDTLIGGLGDDTYYLADATTIVQENVGEGTDWEGAEFSFTLADNVENLFLIDGAGDIDGTGNDLDNVLEGNEGDNVLDGGLGSDTVDYSFESARVLVYLDIGLAIGATSGTDTLVSIENATGSFFNDLLVGDANANILDGWIGDDQMQGGAGDDIYVVDSYHDIVRENIGEGTDTVMAEVDYKLSANVENLTLTLSALLGTGNDLNNTITGNDNNNELHGKDGNDTLDGGTGGDSMYGEGGDDTYVVDDITDVVSELSHGGDAGGTDTVEASISYHLGSFVEDLVLTGTSGLSGWGNSAANSLTGNSGSNVLHGGGGNDTLDGGGGSDTLYGEAGDDTYVVANTTTKVSEYQYGVDAGGTDTVEASVNFALGKFVENLTLTGTAISATGNGLGNTLIGNGEDNIIDGHAGADTLTGGSGADTFVFGLWNGADIITDFSDTEGDTIDVTAWHLANAPVITYVGGDAVITLSASNTITIQNATPGDPDIASHILW